MTSTGTSNNRKLPSNRSISSSITHDLDNRYLIFDWENTLVNSRLNQRISWKQAIAWYNNNFQAHLDEPEFHDIFHTKYFPHEGSFSSYDKVHYIFSELGLDLDTVSVFLNVYRNYYKKRTYLMIKQDKNGSFRYLQQLSNHTSINVGIVSDNSIAAREAYLYILLQLGLADAFDFFVVSEALLEETPELDLISAALELWEVEPEAVTFVGNNLIVGDVAETNGLNFVYVNGFQSSEDKKEQHFPTIGHVSASNLKQAGVNLSTLTDD